MDTHHENGPSALYRRGECSASMLAERGLPDAGGADAEEGQHLHNMVVLAHRQIIEFGSVKAELFKDLTDEQTDATLVCVNLLTSFDGQGDPWALEEPLNLCDPKTFEVVTFGTPDAVKVIPEKDLAILADWKFGRNPVSSPAMNLQFAAYAAMVMQTTGVSRVECYLIQPRVWEKPEPFAFTKVEGIIGTIKAIIARCHELELKRHAGDHCKYCKAKSECSAFNQFSTSVVTLDPLAVTAENAADISSFITQIRKQCDRASGILKDTVRECGGRLGNLQMHETRGDRFADARELYGCVQDIVSPDEFMGLVEPKVGKVEDLFATKMKEIGAAKTKKEAKATFNEFPAIKRKRSSESLKIVRS